MNEIQKDDRYKRAVLRVNEMDKLDAKFKNKLPSEASKHAHLVTCLAALEAGLRNDADFAIWEALVMLHSLEKRMR
jgi:hypothetical protein